MKISVGDEFDFNYESKLDGGKYIKILTGNYQVTGTINLKYNEENIEAFDLPKLDIKKNSNLIFYIFIFKNGSDILNILSRSYNFIQLNLNYAIRKDTLYNLDCAKIKCNKKLI